MKPTELDDSLLTAYLDDELSYDERLLVEEQLKGNTEWKQLLSELESVRALIQQMPKPVLSHPIANGPWNDSAAIPQPKIERTVARPESTKSWLSIGRLALAASLLVGGFVSMIIMRSENGTREMAKTESLAAEQEKANDAKNGTMKLQRAAPAVVSEVQLVPVPTEKKKLKLRSAVSSDRPTLPDAVETFYFKCDKLPLKESNRQRLQMNEKVDLNVGKASLGFQNSEQPPSDTSNSLNLDKASGQAFASASVVEFTEGRQYNFCFQRSEWPTVAIELQSMGIEPPIATPNEDVLSRKFRSFQFEPAKEEALKFYPPTLMGVIGEPTDWIRVVVTVEGSDSDKSASELNK